MRFTTADIKGLLKEYRKFKVKITLGVASKDIHEKIDFLDACISELSDWDRHIIISVYEKKSKLTALARDLGVSRRTVYRYVEMTVELFAELFNLKFCK